MPLLGNLAQKDDDSIRRYLEREAARHYIHLNETELDALTREILTFAREPNAARQEDLAQHGPMVVIPLLEALSLVSPDGKRRKLAVELLLSIERPILKELIEYIGVSARDSSCDFAQKVAFLAVSERAFNGVEDLNTALDFLKALLRHPLSERPGMLASQATRRPDLPTADDITRSINLLTKFKATRFKFSRGQSVYLRESMGDPADLRGLAGKVGVVIQRTPYDQSFDVTSASNRESHNRYRVKFTDAEKMVEENQLEALLRPPA
jgi:hypothetical protein